MTRIKFPDEGLAVFNMHVNDAGKRALSVCEAFFPEKDLLELKDAYKTGIMAIFDDFPTPVTRLFSTACLIFANGLDKRMK